MKLHYVNGDDWVGLYVDGVLKKQGHSLDVRDIIEALNLEYETLFPDAEWLFEVGYLPESIDDVVEE
jgi:hypothetical protein